MSATRILYLGIQRESAGDLYASVHRWDADTGEYLDQVYPASGIGDKWYTIDHIHNGPNGRVYIGMGSFVGSGAPAGSIIAGLVALEADNSILFNVNWPVGFNNNLYYSNIYSIHVFDDDSIFVAPWVQNTFLLGYALWEFDAAGSPIHSWLGEFFQGIAVTSIVNVSAPFPTGVIYHTYGAGGPGGPNVYATYNMQTDAIASWGPGTLQIFARQIDNGRIAAYNRTNFHPPGCPYSIISADGVTQTGYQAPTEVPDIGGLDVKGAYAWAVNGGGLVYKFPVAATAPAPTLVINPADTFPDYASNFGAGRWNTNGMMVQGPDIVPPVTLGVCIIPTTAAPVAPSQGMCTL